MIAKSNFSKPRNYRIEIPTSLVHSYFTYNTVWHAWLRADCHFPSALLFFFPISPLPSVLPLCTMSGPDLLPSLSHSALLLFLRVWMSEGERCKHRKQLDPERCGFQMSSVAGRSSCSKYYIILQVRTDVHQVQREARKHFAAKL